MRTIRSIIGPMVLWISATGCLVIVAQPIASAADKSAAVAGESATDGTAFFERRIRPLLVQHCYECHSEQAGEQQGGLLLDRPSGWLAGGDTNKAVIPGDPESSLLIQAVRYQDGLEMPPDQPLDDGDIELLRRWISLGAPGPAQDMGETDFSRLGDQPYLFDKAADHWAFQPVRATKPPVVSRRDWNPNPIDAFVIDDLAARDLQPSPAADARTLVRRLHYDLTGLPPTKTQIDQFVDSYQRNPDAAVTALVDRLLQSPQYGQHLGRMWLDVARYADTDSSYRPDTRTAHYFPFAFSYRDYVIDALNRDKPYDQFVKEQLAADLIVTSDSAPELAALGFLAAGPYANRDAAEALDDWIDVTTRGLMGLTVACARCHDHKYEPIPTADYYALRGVFNAINRVHPLDETAQPLLDVSAATSSQVADYQSKRATIDAKIAAAEGKKARGNNRSVAEQIRETELAELLLFHPGAPVRAMVVTERPKPPPAFVFVRGDASDRGEPVDRHFLTVLEPTPAEFPADRSGRLELAEKIVAPENPLTARVLVNRIWGQLIGSYLVDTPSDFGLQSSPPTHPALLDHLAADFVDGGYSIKRLVRNIALSQTYRQTSRHRADAAAVDPENRLLWRSNRKHLTIEAIRDSVLAVSGQLDCRVGGRAEPLWGDDATGRRAVYGYVNRFNLDPTLRAFDFPAPMQTQPGRGESIVAPQALFLMNSPLVIGQSVATTQLDGFQQCTSDPQRIEWLFETILQRKPSPAEVARTIKLVELQDRLPPPANPASAKMHSPWPLIAQALMMSNEFQYVD